MKIVSVVGARPNFMKIAPLHREFRKHSHIKHLVVHTGQHYNREMSAVFFDQLGLPEPERDLGVGSGSHGEMTGRIMIAFEKACFEINPDLVIVVGDVNSTIAASLVARKLAIPVAHVEAGLRSFDESMPEEHNRRLTDHLSNFLFVSEPSGMDNLQREGIEMIRAHLVGDIMLETLQMFLPEVRARKRWVDFGMEKGSYALATLHRPSNVDQRDSLEEVIDLLATIPFPVIFPIHPRTIARLEGYELKQRLESIPGLVLTPPEPYIEFLSLLEGSRLILSDSGSVQAESSLFNVPCLICRENTERPIYIEQGTSELIGRDIMKLEQYIKCLQDGTFKTTSNHIRDLGTGVAYKTVNLIVEHLKS